jgi:hypothetical protein
LAIASVLTYAQAAAGPVIAVKPDNISLIEVPWNQFIQIGLTISNLDSCGTVPLEWTISDVVQGTNDNCVRVTESPLSGTVPPADSEIVTVTFNTTGHAAGTYTIAIDLRIDSNDPVHPSVTIPVTMTVVVPTSVRRLTFGQLKARYR